MTNAHDSGDTNEERYRSISILKRYKSFLVVNYVEYR